MNLSRGEVRALRALDAECYADAEAGGDGWATASDVGRRLACSYEWARQRMHALVDTGAAERVEGTVGGRPSRLYAPSEDGAELLAAIP